MTSETLREAVANREADKWGFFLITPIPDTHFFVNFNCSKGPLDLVSLFLHFFPISQVQTNSSKGIQQDSEDGGKRGESMAAGLGIF